MPAAIGAKVGRPDRTVWAIDGDGCFQMTAQELVTASSERIPIKVAILNNAYLGMVRQWQEMFYQERYSEVYLSPDLPDYVKWAEAMGCVAFRVEHADDVGPVVDKANAIDDRPVVIDFRTDSQEKVFPMVAAGQSNSDVIVHPSPPPGRRKGGAVMSARQHRQHLGLWQRALAPPDHFDNRREPRRCPGPGLGAFCPQGLQHNLARPWRLPTTTPSAGSPSWSTWKRPQSSS